MVEQPQDVSITNVAASTDARLLREPSATLSEEEGPQLNDTRGSGQQPIGECDMR
jgi:hypothetical protein